MGVVKRTFRDYFKLHKSSEAMRPKLTAKSIQYIINQMKNGKDTDTVAKEMHVTQRHIQWLWAEYLKTGTAHQQILAGRPRNPVPSDLEIQALLDAHRRRPEGAVRTDLDHCFWYHFLHLFPNNHVSHLFSTSILPINSSGVRYPRAEWILSLL